MNNSLIFADELIVGEVYALISKTSKYDCYLCDNNNHTVSHLPFNCYFFILNKTYYSSNPNNEWYSFKLLIGRNVYYSNFPAYGHFYKKITC